MRFFALLTVGLVSTTVFIGLATSPANSLDSAVLTETVRLEYFPEKTTAADDGLFSYTATTAANDTFSIPEGEEDATFTTDIYTTDIDATGFGAKLTGKNFDNALGNGVEITVTFDGSREHQLSGVSAHTKEPLPSNIYVTEPISAQAVETFQLTIKLSRNSDGSSPIIDDVEIILFDASTDDLPISGGISIAAAETEEQADVTTSATSEPEIVTRAEWGADEAYRENSEGEEIWPREYEDVKAFIIHHTAGGDGGADPASTIRGIYYWHAQVLGWGDIGYNYLIDGNGVIYKGRKGKDGVIGAHTYNSVDEINYNEGSIGIALMGCFDETGCDTAEEISPAAKKALTDLIGFKAAQLGIEPKSKVEFKGAEAKRVGGHQDYDYTYCPGSAVLGDMSDIRTDAQEAYQSYQAVSLLAERSEVALYERSDLKAQESKADADALNLNKKYGAIISYKNTGTESWAQSDMNLRVLRKSGRGITHFRHKKSWPHRYGKFAMNEETVAPGETATFTFNIKSLKKRRGRTMSLKLYDGSQYVAESKGTVTLTFTKPFAGNLAEHTLPAAMFAGTSQEVTFTFTNTGIKNWGDGVEAVLNGEPIGGFDSIVAPGESGTITTTVTAGQAGQVQDFTVKLRRQGKKISGTKQTIASRID